MVSAVYLKKVHRSLHMSSFLEMEMATYCFTSDTINIIIACITPAGSLALTQRAINKSIVVNYGFDLSLGLSVWQRKRSQYICRRENFIQTTKCSCIIPDVLGFWFEGC